MAHVLIVEDDSQVRVLAESVLQEAGHQTLSAGTVAEAQAIVQSDQKFDLVFTDIELANHPEGGIKVGRMVAETRPVPILYTSGRGLTDGMRTLFAERSAFLAKPYTGQQLLEAVDALLTADGRNQK